MKKVLITGGSVQAPLDAVKFITNGFEGGLILELAEKLAEHGTEVTYLCSRKAKAKIPSHLRIKVIDHSGIFDYRTKVTELSPHMDGVILGAAVANIICTNPLKGKFPSHDYKPGDPVDYFKYAIAPRIIDDVKKVAPKTHLFGFKFLDNVPHDELIRAAYKIVLDAKATAVIANDGRGLMQKCVVTKERGVHPMKQADLADWIWEMLNDDYYSTKFVEGSEMFDQTLRKLFSAIKNYEDKFLVTESGLIFGTIAVRNGSGFVTTGRGKRELDSIANIVRVDHDEKIVYAAGNAKASLNAPLLARMFENPEVDMIVHYHEQVPDLPTYPYAPPGTVRDSIRLIYTSFNIAEHGCMLLFDKNGRML